MKKVLARAHQCGKHAEPAPEPFGPREQSHCRLPASALPAPVAISGGILCIRLGEERRLSALTRLAGTGSVGSVSRRIKKKKSSQHGPCLAVRAHAFVSFSFSSSGLRCFYCVALVVVFCWLTCAESSFRCLCASSCLSRSVLKKSSPETPPSWSPSLRVSPALRLSQECR